MKKPPSLDEPITAVQTMLEGLPRSMPALLKAYRLGQKVSRVGFDWSDLKEVEDKLEEERNELDEEINKAREGSGGFSKEMASRIEEELGDVLFVLAQYARHLNIEPERALQKANQKFVRRFKAMEVKAKEQLDEGNNPSLEEWESYWSEVKQEER